MAADETGLPWATDSQTSEPISIGPAANPPISTASVSEREERPRTRQGAKLVASSVNPPHSHQTNPSPCPAGARIEGSQSHLKPMTVTKDGSRLAAWRPDRDPLGQDLHLAGS